MEAKSPFDYQLFRQEAVDKLRTGEHNLTSLYELLNPVIKDLLETVLLQSKPLKKEPDNVVVLDPVAEKKVDKLLINKDADIYLPSRRQESYQKSIKPSIKREVLAWFEEGSSYQTIQKELLFSQGIHLNLDEILQITDQFLPQIEAWRKRLLQPVYACLWITNTLCYLWQEGSLIRMTVYSVVAADLLGNQDILGYYVDDRSTGEFWPVLLADLQSRGVKDILIVCVNEPALLTALIHQIYPQTHVHGCITQHLHRTLHSIKGTDLTKIKKQLKLVYQATDLAEVRLNWQGFKETWQSRYPLLVDSWEHNWDILMGSMDYPYRVRRLTQGISSLTNLQEQLLKISTLNGTTATEVEVLKSLYLDYRKKFSKSKATINNWGLIIQELGILFGERVPI